MTFLNPSTLCRFRQRRGKEGTLIIAAQVLEHLTRRSVIDADLRLMDTTVLESPIIDPTDVRLLSQAFDKMAALATDAKRDLGWDQSHVKQRWRAYNLNQKDRLASRRAFSTWFVPACASFAEHLAHLPDSPLRQRWSHLLARLSRRNEPTQQPWAGQSHMDHRLVSLDDLEARPIKKGQSHPSTAWGTTLQITCNRHGFMMTTDHVIGPPNDTTLSGPTWPRFRERLPA
jgi:hypothetical protein